VKLFPRHNNSQMDRFLNCMCWLHWLAMLGCINMCFRDLQCLSYVMAVCLLTRCNKSILEHKNMWQRLRLAGCRLFHQCTWYKLLSQQCLCQLQKYPLDKISGKKQKWMLLHHRKILLHKSFVQLSCNNFLLHK
jgi:hypothetical protein